MLSQIPWGSRWIQTEPLLLWDLMGHVDPWSVASSIGFQDPGYGRHLLQRLLEDAWDTGEEPGKRFRSQIDMVCSGPLQ